MFEEFENQNLGLVSYRIANKCINNFCCQQITLTLVVIIVSKGVIMQLTPKTDWYFTVALQIISLTTIASTNGNTCDSSAKRTACQLFYSKCFGSVTCQKERSMAKLKNPRDYTAVVHRGDFAPETRWCFASLCMFSVRRVMDVVKSSLVDDRWGQTLLCRVKPQLVGQLWRAPRPR